MKYICSIAILLILVSCSHISDKKFDKYGLSFAYPFSWSIIEEEDMGDGFYSVILAKNGNTGNAILSINTYSGKDDELNWHLETIHPAISVDCFIL